MSSDSFLEDNEVQEIAQAHIEQIVALEKREAERVIRAYRSIRSDLRDRLDSMPRGSFTAQQMRGVLFQIESAISAMSGSLKYEMDSSAQAAAEKGIEDLLSEISKFDGKFLGAVAPIDLDAVVVATDTKNFLFNRYEASMRSYNELLRARFAQGLSQAAIEEVSMSEVVQRVGQTFLGEEWKVHQIVRTELHNVYATGKMNGMKRLWDNGNGDIPDLKKALFHPMDNRTGQDSKKAAALELVVPIDEPFVYTWKGETRKFMAPPDRPNDRSILIPYRDSWN